jgi:hypothetical protein
VEDYLDLPPGSLSECVVDQRLQLWGAGVPLNTYQSRDDDDGGFVYDAPHGVGVCGDWLVDPSVAGAWTSGRNLARHLLSDPCPDSRGLQGSFVRSDAAVRSGIGALDAAGERDPTSPLATPAAPASSPQPMRR